MFNVGPLELIVVLIIALIVLGPERLPDVARSVGRGVREFRASLDRPDADEYEDEPTRIEATDEEESERATPDPGAPHGAEAEPGAPDAAQPDPAAPHGAEPQPAAYQNDADSSESSSSSSGLV